MSTWILQHFLNPTFFWPGMALLAAPIIIHLIHRLRYRRVRFAAMEFLLASEQRNRRRILFEQLLLLLLRIVMVLIVLGLIGRFILDPAQMSLFQGARSHHVVILDDTASMQDRDGDEQVFDTAKDVIRKMVAEGARRPGTQQLTLIRVSEPEETLSGLSARAVDDVLLSELNERLDVMACTNRSADPAAALEAAIRRLADDRAVLRHVHVLSDFRDVDWIDNKGAVSALQTLAAGDVELNLVRCVETGHENLGVVSLGGAVDIAAAGVPVTLQAVVRNWGTREAQDVRAELFINDVRLPRTIDFQSIPAGEEGTKSFDLVFETPQPHEVRLSVAEDLLEVDNARFLAVDVPVENPVLIIDGSPATEQAYYVADALAADKSVTGFAPDIRPPEDLRRVPLDKFHLIYLINVPELAPDAISALEKYVSSGGGLVWYMGDAVRPAFYNENLFAEETALFPVRLGVAPTNLDRPAEAGTIRADLADLHGPLFRLFTDTEVPILDLVFVNLFYPIDERPEAGPGIMKDARILATLSNRRPLILEHDYGTGRVLTTLTSAGPLMNPEGMIWTNWANGPAGFSFAVFQLELAKYLSRSDRALPNLPAGDPIETVFSQAYYQSDVEFISPDDQSTRIQASRPPNQETSSPGEEVGQLRAIYRETDMPGVYSVTLTTQDQAQERQLYALNVDPDEGALQVMNDEALLRELGENVAVTIQPAGDFEWIRSESPGSEIRWFLLVLFAVVCMGEQALASRLSYLPD